MFLTLRLLIYRLLYYIGWLILLLISAIAAAAGFFVLAVTVIYVSRSEVKAEHIATRVFLRICKQQQLSPTLFHGAGLFYVNNGRHGYSFDWIGPNGKHIDVYVDYGESYDVATP